MASFLLVHGTCHGAWCWDDLIPELTALGHRARAIDLPAHGLDRTPAAEATLAGYGARIVAEMQTGDIVLGHSAGGYAITAAAEMAPEQFGALVYLCAYVPVSGLSLADMRRAGPRQPLAAAIRRYADGVTFGFDPALAQDRFYHDCPPDTLGRALTHLVPEPIAPQETPLSVTARAASVRRFYIRCLQDRAIPPEYQETMAAGFAPGTVSTLDASHSPFFAMPRTLAQRLDEIARA